MNNFSMTVPMPDSFDDLTGDMLDELNSWISKMFLPRVQINKSHTAYGLKQKFHSKLFHLTSKTFMEAMRNAGYACIQTDETESNWHFNISADSPIFRLRGSSWGRS